MARIRRRKTKGRVMLERKLRALRDALAPQFGHGLFRHGLFARRPGVTGTLLLVAVAGSCTPFTDGADLRVATVLDAAAGGSTAAPLAPPPAQAVALASILDLPQPDAELAEGQSAFFANAALPLSTGPNPAAASLAFSGTDISRLRAVDCLAQAIYYEAASQSEAGQRAVAQVVLNRVRHPAWPNSVCGVVYQGPLRAGGGCQFTFTCDGSLGRRPSAEGWVRARRYAEEALAGFVFSPVGLSTFYHANYVMPAWAPRLNKVTQIGAHIFYRLPGNWGQPGAFSDRYAGVEPIARPNPIPAFMLARQDGAAGAVPVSNEMPTWLQDAARRQNEARLANSAPAPEIAAPRVAITPESQVQPEFRQSGQWRTDAPAALTGR